MQLTTLCYIEKDNEYLMLHRTKKKNDINKDMWIGVGGHFEDGESPDECLLREVREETGLILTSYKLRGIVTFLSDESEGEYMFLYTSDSFEGEIKECDEGELKYISRNELYELNLWAGDEIFLRLLRDERNIFDLKVEYEGRRLKRAVLNGEELELFDVLDDNFEETGMTRERTAVHETGTCHKTSHVWVYRKKTSGFDVLLQKRSENKDSFPGYYDISSAGHIRAGDEYLESALRELEEELGICARSNELKMVGVHNGMSEMEFYGRKFINNEHSMVYVYDGTDIDISSLKLQKEEVESVKWIDYEVGKKSLFTGEIKNCVYVEEWEMLGKYFSEIEE